MSLAEDFVKFVNASPSPFHAVEECVKRLLSHGFTRLKEIDEWSLRPLGKYFFTRNYSTIFAFSIGGQFAPGNGFNVIGAHTDSPVLRVKPISTVTNQNFLQVGVEPYGGGIWHSWFDRDLGLAGRVILKRQNKLEHRLVNIRRPILRIPTLAIHLERDVNEAFKFNQQTHLLPVLATSIKSALEAPTKHKHHLVLLKLLAEELSCEVDDIADFELSLFDVQPSVIGGALNEFVFSARLDNLLSSYLALQALIDTSSEDSLTTETRIRVAALFDNEEVGSESERGAGATITEHFFKRCSVSIANTPPAVLEPQHSLFERSIRKSFLVSADMAHACHPNYPEKHEHNHKPEIHKGPVIKNNAKQRYATTSVTGFVLRELARRHEIPFQEFVVRNDVMCGSTIGPIMSAFGLRTVDVGSPQLSMHSIREMCGTDDIAHSFQLFKAFYSEGTQLDESLEVD